MPIDFPIMFVFKGRGAIAETGEDFASVSEQCWVVRCEKPALTIYQWDSLIVDSSGHCYKIEKVEREHYWKGGIRAFLKRLNSAKIEVYIQVQPIQGISLQELKEALISSWESGNPCYWEECVGDTDFYRKRIKEAKSFREVIQITLDPWGEMERVGHHSE
jgi:hypothetical protein